MRIIRFFCMVFFLIILCVAAKIVFQVPMETVMAYYWPIAAGVIFLCLLIQIGYSLYYCRKSNRLLPLLKKEKEYDQYILQATALSKACKNKMLQAILQINLAAAYTEKKEYEKAKSLLEAIDPARVRRMKGLHKAVYFANLAYLYFYLDEQGKALQIMEERKKLFAAHQNDNSSGFAVVYGVLTAFTSFIKGDEVLAREQMESVQASFPEADLDRDLAFLAQGM